VPDLELQVGRRHVRLTSPDKLLFPGDGVTKRDLADYYAAIGDTLVPHLRNRPFTLKRYPYGIRGQPYFAKQVPKGKPSWVPTRQFRTWPREGGSRLVDFALVNEPAAAVWMVQMNCIDMNAWYSRVDKPDRPDFVLFDLDPPESRNGFVEAIRVAHLIREALERLELRSYVKTSGADGIHVLVPITRRSTYKDTYDFAELVSRRVEAENPGLATTEWLKKKRRPSPERPRQDDRLRLLGAAQARRAGLDAAALGGARREGAPARLRQARGARSRGEARRPVRAGATGRAGPRASAARAPFVTALVVGSGPNGLAAAIALLQGGVEAEVREAADWLGGGLHSEELTLPGFVHDVCATAMPLAAGSPFFNTLGLDVQWIHPEAPAAHPLDDGTAVLLERGVEETIEELGRDGPAYRRLVEPLVEAWEELAPAVLGPLPPTPRRSLRASRAVGPSALARATWRPSATRVQWPRRCSRPSGRAPGSRATARMRCCRSSGGRAPASGSR
jgi:bifunctional non-homologous end joining protein LigD